jgi:hypothetical protein
MLADEGGDEAAHRGDAEADPIGIGAVICTMAQATRLSSFCLTMATASISEP